MLFTLTEITSFLTMTLAIWLGLYIVTRSPRSAIAWLTGLTLWSIASVFKNVLLALNPPPQPAWPDWLWLFLPFWHTVALKGPGATGWLQGWSITPGIMLWHHVTTLMRPGPLTPWRWTRILGGYALIIVALILQANTHHFFVSASGDDPLYLKTLEVGPLYPLLAFFILLYIGLSVTNLINSARTAPTSLLAKQFILLAVATLMGGLTGPLSIAASMFKLPMPVLALALPLGLAVGLIGYGVARYSALVKGRTIRRDFFYNAVVVSVVTGLYLLITWISVQIYNIPAAAFVLVVMFAIISHALIDVARSGLDSLFYERDTRRLRAHLRQLARLAGEQLSQEEQLSLTLDTLAASVGAIFGLVVLFESGSLRLAAACRWPHRELPLALTDLLADDVLPLKPGHFAPPLAEAALLIPLYAENQQVGVLILGRPGNGVGYSKADLELLLYPSDRLAGIIQNARRETEYLTQLAGLVEQNRAEAESPTSQISIKGVENALRNLTDYAYLGEHPLASLNLVACRLAPGATTHLDRGKLVYTILAEAIAKLRPAGKLPPDPPPAEWTAYLILHDAYLEDIPNREIMARLYISEGTFNRTRRAALRAVTRTLEEMEAAQGE
ncbi:MAG: GAF domain-containing protein [Anaerolineae bacterium]|nr:GAF domain-containing protein [Anaerolineae bacterium]